MTETRTAKEWQDICSHITSGYVPSRGTTYDSGIKLVELLQDRFGIFADCASLDICDVGSGNGRLAMGLLATNRKPKSYCGLEIIPTCVDFCNKAFAPYPNFMFVRLNASNPRYWTDAQAPELVKFPLADESVNLVVANSLFSHTGTFEIAQRNLNEMFRILKPNGVLYSSWIIRAKRDPNPAMTKYTLLDAAWLLHPVSRVMSIGDHSQPRQTGFICIK